ncbi:MAG: ribonuclease protein component [Bacteroidota bacterium]|jgi:ribonuclease P protein component
MTNLQHSGSLRYTFRKEERLCSDKIVAGLFQSGIFVSKYPFRANVLVLPSGTPGPRIQILLSAPKRRFKRAVDRNRLKRLMREVYRMRKHELYAELERLDMHLAVALIYTGTEMMDHAAMEKAFDKLMQRWLPALPEWKERAL